jgi:YVTN family beta-propeller protein
MNKLLWSLALLAVSLAAAPKKPVYVGARACAACHGARSMGDQYSQWLHSKHSRAWAALARPESREITKLSGLRDIEPQQSVICLGCHATAAHTEDWERDPDFHIEEGVQCEACHGPGSEYMTESVMRDRQAAMKAGLLMPTERECVNCHLEKGSHIAVLHGAQFDFKKAWESVKHALPKDPAPGPIPPVAPADEKAKDPRFAGSAVCGECHRGPRMGHQYSIWRMSPHARAWAVLGTARGRQVAKERGVAEPQTDWACLKCHAPAAVPARLASAQIEEGVGCEACHGAGSEYLEEAIMHDRTAAARAGLRKPVRETCLGCHNSKTFQFDDAVKKIAHPKTPVLANGFAPEPKYKNPLNMAIRPGGAELWVTCETGDTVAVIDLAVRKKVAEIETGGAPTGIAFTPDGKRAFVTNRLDDTLAVIDAAARKVVKTLPTGDEPHGVATDRLGRLLYVLNTSSDDISVFDAASLKWLKSLAASRGPWAMSLSPDGSTMLVTNTLSQLRPLRSTLLSEVTQVETERGTVEDRLRVPGANLMMGVAWHPSGRFALATLNRTKNLVPMTRLLQGWTITNGLAVIWRTGEVDQVLLDEPDMGFADVTGIVCTPDGRYALATSSGTNRIAVIDIAALTRLIQRSSKYDREHVLPNHLGFPTEFVAKHIPTGRSPRGIAIGPDGKTAYVANCLDDTIGVIDLARLAPAGVIDLGGPRVETRQRFGERVFHNAKVTFHRQYSCHSCHPDGHVDSVTYDIESDGIGVSPVDNRTLRGILDTAPFKWEGTNPNLSRQCGARLSVFFTRLAPFTPDELSAVDYYVTTIPRPPNRYRALNAPLTPAQRRGKIIFYRTVANDGREIPVENRCSTCHFPPYFTDRRLHDVGTRHPLDRQAKFDVPHLNNIYDSAPYLHNGSAATLEEIWTIYNPNDRHGVTNDMTKDQLNDLIEYVKTL